MFKICKYNTFLCKKFINSLERLFTNQLHLKIILKKRANLATYSFNANCFTLGSIEIISTPCQLFKVDIW